MGRRNCIRKNAYRDKQRKRQERQKVADSFVYQPVTSTWMKQKATDLGLPVTQLDLETSDTDAFSSIQLTTPTTFYNTKPDGNCFFNAISFVITGSEDYHYVVRNSICNHILQNVDQLRGFLPTQYNGNAQKYINETRMTYNATWATEMEIFATSHMLKTTIYIYTKHGVHWKWLRHATGNQESTHSIYLFHRCQNHYDVVLSVGHSSVLNQFPSNIKTYLLDHIEKDKKQKQKAMEREKYKNDVEWRNTKKEQSKLQSKIKYTENSKYREQKASAAKHNYRHNEVHREQKKSTARQAYKNREEHREQKKFAARNAYKNREEHRVQKKLAARNAYKNKEEHREQKKSAARYAYKNRETYREHKKSAARYAYKNREEHREHKKSVARNSYWDNEIRREQQKSALRHTYRDNDAYRERKKLAAKQRYMLNKIYQEHKKHISIMKYATNAKFRHTVRSYAKSKYHQMEAFRISVKHYSKAKYRQKPEFKQKVKAYSKAKYGQKPEFKQKVREYSKAKYRQKPEFKQKVKEYSKAKYGQKPEFKQKVREYSKAKYGQKPEFKQKVKEYSKAKYGQKPEFKQKVKEYSKAKYGQKPEFKQKVEEYSKAKYRAFHSFRFKLRAASVKRYASNPLFRKIVKEKLVKLYQNSSDIRNKKKHYVKERRSSISTAIQQFQRNICEVPKYVCTVCVRILYKNQVKICRRTKYMENGILSDQAKVCLTGKYIHKCNQKHCQEPCPKKHAEKEWICYTCDRHLSAGNMPPQAQANGLILVEIPETLSKLNHLERQLVALRIPFMKLLSLPRGGQKGIKGQVVNVPSDVNSVTSTLPRTIDEAQMVRVKLKRKLIYKGHHQYEWVNPASVIQAVKHLIDHNLWYSGVDFIDDWFDQDADSDIIRTEKPESDSNDEEPSQHVNEIDQKDDVNQLSKIIQVTNNCNNLQEKNNTKKDQSSNNETQQSIPAETCFQPLDLGQEFLDTSNKVFCLAPGDNQIPKNIFQEKGAEAMAFPVLFPDGNFGFTAERDIKLTPAKYFNARLFSADNRFAKDCQFIFYAQYMVEMQNIRSNISIALRKGKQTTADGKKITATMLTDSGKLQKNILKSDTGYRFMQPIRGTPPYWQRTMKDLFAMIRQLGIPTWFVTFSAGETRWEEVISTLRKEDKRSLTEIEWTERCKMIRDNPVMCARLFNNRVQNLFTHMIRSPAQPIGEVVDYFYRTEFQQRGSPHIHCLFWVKDAPKLDEDSDKDICKFVDKYISCQLPNQQDDPELFDIVTAVQIHNKAHTKSCRKKSTTCRFNFPKPPVMQTFIARADALEEDIPPVSQKDQKIPTKEEFDEKCKNASRSAKEIVKDVWTIINSIGNIEDHTIADVLKAADVTYSKFKESLEIATTKNTIFHKRKMSDCWVNNYNPHLLKAWNANIDIQFVMDAYSCVAYILSYISKAEAEVGELLGNAQKEAREGNKDAAAAMKHIGQAYIQNREVSAQEAVYRVCGMHLKECSRDVVFIPTGNNVVKMSLPINVLESRGKEDNENVWVTSITDKYFARPENKQLNNLCLAEFASKYKLFPRTRPPKKTATSLPVYEMKNDLGFMKKKTSKKKSIIRYPRFNQLKNPEEYYMSLIQLYVPHRQPITKPTTFQSYEEYVRYGTQNGESLLNIISKNRHHFEVDIDDLEKAWEDLQDGKIGEDAWAHVAPEAEAQRLEKDENVYPDELPEPNPDLDISPTSEKKQNMKDQAIEFHKPKVTNREIRNNLRSMNIQQQCIFYRIRDWAFHVSWNKYPKPFHAFVTGGAGTGKSHLIKCVYHEMTRILAKTNENPEAVSVLLTAPTGTAAFNIGGLTVHSAFAISKNIRLPYTPLGENILNTLRAKYSNLQLVIIDEISMIDHKILTYIHGRLCQLKQSKNLFGNVSILAVGDFYQLPPVKASPLYKVRDAVALDLWNPVFSVATLTEVMRQKDDAKFANLLNRLREHKRGDALLTEDTETLKAISCKEVPVDCQNVLHIFSTNKEVADHNDNRVASVCQPCLTLLAKDFIRSHPNGQLLQRENPYSVSSSEDLPVSIKLGVQARVMLLRNIDTEDGLVNGAFGTITALEKSKSGDVKALYVKFDNSLCGKRNISNTVSTVPGSENAVRITPIEESLAHKNAVRRQFPLRLGWGATIHKIQGTTAQNIVVSLKTIFQPGMAYVALSRATSLHGLHILDLDTDTIYASQDIKQSLENMTQFLSEPAPSSKTNSKQLKIAMHNTQGLIPHVEDIIKATVFKDADIICFTETWLNKTNYIPPCLFPDFQLYTLHRESAYASFHQMTGTDLASTAHGGVMIALKSILSHSRCSLQVDNLEYVAVKVQTPKPFFITIIYRPPVYPLVLFTTALHHLLTAIEENSNTPILILGDFNDDDLNANTLTRTVFQQYGFHQIVKTPTTEAGTCLDLVFIKGLQQTEEPKIDIVPIYYSFHDVVTILQNLA